MTTALTNTWMPAIEQYMALAETMHDNDDLCNASYYHPFSSCEEEVREYFIDQAIAVLRDLRREDWRMVRDGGATTVMVPDLGDSKWPR
jgi:hypothetical protein